MRRLLRTFALFAVVPYVGVLLLLATGSASWSSVSYMVATGVLLAGLLTLPEPAAAADGELVEEGRRRRRPRGLSRGGLAALATVAIVRAAVAGDGRALHNGNGALGNDGKMDAARLVNRLVDEGDVAMAGTRVLLASGMLHDDAPELSSAMSLAYRELRRSEGDAPSPVVATYLGIEHPEAFDLTIIEPLEDPAAVATAETTHVRPANQAPPRSAIVFLHGFAGNFDLPCFQVAHAMGGTNTVTACPSTRWIGDWWSPEGERTVRRTLALLHARGIDRIVLVGLSNGGYGVSRLAPRLSGMLAGIVMISGAMPNAPSPGVPALVIHGRRDTMASFRDAQTYASRTGAQMVALDAGHFAMLVRSEETNRALRGFVTSRASARAGL